MKTSFQTLLAVPDLAIENAGTTFQDFRFSKVQDPQALELPKAGVEKDPGVFTQWDNVLRENQLSARAMYLGLGIGSVILPLVEYFIRTTNF